MLVYYRASDGQVVYQGATGLPVGAREALEESDWRHNLGPQGFTPNEIHTLWVEEDDPVVVAMLLEHELEVDTAAAKPVVRSKGRRMPAPLPETITKQQGAAKRLTALRKKGAAALTPLERNEVLDLMMLERTPPHELMGGG